MLLLSLLLLLRSVEATHWAYGTFNWKLEPEKTHRGLPNDQFPNKLDDSSRKSYEFEILQGWRHSYFSDPALDAVVEIKGCQPKASMRFFKHGQCNQGGWSATTMAQNNALFWPISQYSFDRQNSPCCHNYGPSSSSNFCRNNGNWDKGPQASDRLFLFSPYTKTQFNRDFDVEDSYTGGQTFTLSTTTYPDANQYMCPSTWSGSLEPRQSMTDATNARKNNINLYVTAIFNKPDYFRGESTIYVYYEQSQTYNYDIEFYYEDCCRLSSLQNENQDQWFRVQGKISRAQKYGLRIEGAPRIRLRRNVVNTYFLFGTHAEGHVLEYFFAGAGKSRLKSAVPNTGTNFMALGANGGDNAGVTTWRPTTNGLFAVGFMIVDTGHPKPAPGAPIPLAIPERDRSFTPLDFIFEVSDSQGPYFTHPYHELDPAYTDARNRIVEFFVNIEGQYTVCSRDDKETSTAATMCAGTASGYCEDNPTTMVRGRRSTELSTFSVEVITPSGTIGGCRACWREKTGFTNGQDNPMCFTQSWTPKYGDTDKVATYISYNQDGVQSIGLYQVYLKVITDIIYVSGVIRDFHDDGFDGHQMKHPDFVLPVTNTQNKNGFDRATVNNAAAGGETTTGLVKRQLGSNGKPILRTTSAASMTSTRASAISRTWESMPEPKPPLATGNPETCAVGAACLGKGGFYDWFVTDEQGVENALPPEQLINMQRVYSVALSRTNAVRNVFTFDTDFFYPIDNQLLGNEGDDHNHFFTWEIKTFLTYSANDILEFQSIDDMWVFVDGTLPVGWTLGGIPPYNANNVPPTQSVALASLGLALGSTYRVDIYYAHRSDRTPAIKIELPDFSLCDGLTDGRKVIEIAAFNTSSKDTLAFGGDLSDGNYFKAQVGVPGFQTKYDVLHLLKRTDSKASAWYHEKGSTTGNEVRLPTPVKLLNGFEAKFDFFVACDDLDTLPQTVPPQVPPPCAEGFAFVLHRNDNSVLGGGSGGSGLGYAGANRVFAVEFDMIKTGDGVDNQQYGFLTDRWSEISYHTRYKSDSGLFPSVQKNEDALNSLGANTNIEDGLPVMHFSNGTYHRVTVQYLTGQKDSNGVQQPGYFRTFINDNLAPIAEAQIEPPNKLDELLGGAAYVGFTASNSVANKADIYISNWQLTLITTSALNTGVDPNNPPESIRAGTTGCAIIQARDICNKDIIVGNEANKFRATFSRLECETEETSDLVWNDPDQGQFGATQGAPDQFGYQPIDNGDGTYTFCYNPTKTGYYSLDITFQEAEGEQRQVINQGNQIVFLVSSADISPGASKLRIPYEELGWQASMGGPGRGIYVRAFTGHGTPFPQSQGTLAATTAAIQSYLNGLGLTTNRQRTTDNPTPSKDWVVPKKDIVVFAKKGTFTDNLSALGLPNNCFVKINEANPVNIGLIDAMFSWVCIVEVAAGGSWTYLKHVYSAGETPRDASGDFTAFHRGLDERTSFTRTFVIAGESAITSCSGYARIGTFHQDVEQPYKYRVQSSTSTSKVLNSYVIEAVDAYGNRDNSGSTFWDVVFPDYPIRDVAYTCGDDTCNLLETCVICKNDCFADNCPTDSYSQGFYVQNIAGNRAADYAMYVSLPAGKLGNSDAVRGEFAKGAESPFNIVIEPGPACLATSSLLGAGINPTAGEPLSQGILVKLADCEGNPITRDRDIDIISGVLTTIENKRTGCSTFDTTDNCAPQDVTFEWRECNADNECNLYATYTPIGSTIRGGVREWSIDLTINSETGSKGLPFIRPNFWDFDTSGPVTEGLIDSYCQAYDKPAELNTYGKLVNAGVEMRCIIQSRDSWGNSRVDNNLGAPVEAGNPPLYYGVDFACDGGTDCLDGLPQVTYANGNGRYYLTFTPKKASTTAKQLRISLCAKSTANANCGGAVADTTTWPNFRFTVLPGSPDTKSILAKSGTSDTNFVPLGTANNVDASTSCTDPAKCQFIIVSLDKYSNLRKTIFNDIDVVAEASDHEVNLVTFQDPPQLGTIVMTSTNEELKNGIFTYQFSQTSPTAFYKIVANTNMGVPITNSQFGTNPPTGERIEVDPANPYAPQSIFTGSGLIGCETGNQAEFRITALDLWGNNMIDDADLATVSVEVIAGTAQPTTGTVTRENANLNHLNTLNRYNVPVSYTVTYMCPSAPGKFEIYVRFNNDVTNNAICGDVQGLTDCTKAVAKPCQATQTLGVCGFSKLFAPEAVLDLATSFAKLYAYQYDDQNNLLAINRATHAINRDGLTNWWYIQDQDATGANKVDPSAQFTVELQDTVNANNRITIPLSDIIKTEPFTGKYWVRFNPIVSGTFTAKIFFNGFSQTKIAGAGSDWESDPFEVTLGQVYPPKSTVEWVTSSVDAGTQNSFLVQLVDFQNNLHTSPYCPRVWDPTNARPVDQDPNTGRNCDQVRVKFSLQGQDTEVTCTPDTTTTKWKCDYSLTRSGEYTVRVYSQVQGSGQDEVDSIRFPLGFKLTVRAGAPSPLRSYLSAAASGAVYTAGVPTDANLILLDEFGNPATVPASFGETVSGAWSTGTGSLQWIEVDSTGNEVRGKVRITHALIDEASRVYQGGAWQDGNNQVILRFNGATVKGIAGSQNQMTDDYYSLKVQHGSPCTGVSCQTGKVSSLTCASGTIAGNDLALTLTVYDIMGNGWFGNMPLLDGSQLSPSSSQLPTDLQKSSTTPGVYSITFRGTRTQVVNKLNLAGTVESLKYTFQIRLDDDTGAEVVITNTDDGCVINPAATDVNNSPLFYVTNGAPSESFTPVQPTNTITYLIVPRDKYGNYRTAPDNEIWQMGFDIDSTTGGAVRCPEDSGAAETSEAAQGWTIGTVSWDNTLLGFIYSATTQVAGEYSVSMKLGADTARCGTRKNWIQIVCAGSPNAATSYFDFSGSSVALSNPQDSSSKIQYIAGTILRIETVLQDQWGNPVVQRDGCSGGSADVRVNNGDASNTIVANSYEVGSSTGCSGAPDGVCSTQETAMCRDCWVKQQDVALACATLFKKESCAYPQSVQRFPTDKDGRTLFEINVTEAREFSLVPAIKRDDQSWQALVFREGSAFYTSMNTNKHVFLTVPAQASRFTITDNTEQPLPVDDYIATAAVPGAFLLFAADLWENRIQDSSGYTYKVRFDSNLVDYGFEVSDFSNYYGVNGVEDQTGFCNQDKSCDTYGTRAVFMSSWHGAFSITASIYPQGSDVSAWSETINRRIYHATCNFENEQNNYRCADDMIDRFDSTCQPSYSECTDLNGQQNQDLMQSFCSDGSMVTDPLTCPCEQGSRINGVCSTVNVPIVLAPCPTGTQRCPERHRSQCRVSLDECPTVRVCPPGWITCGDGVTCARANNNGEPGVSCPLPATCINSVPCWDGHCRPTAEDCPTPKTCADPGHILCADGSCQASRADCPDRYNCFGGQRPCPDGSCRDDLSGCPSKVTCPVGQVLCESGECAPRLSACPEALRCSLDQVRCPDGSCTNNLLFCAAQITCRPEVPVKCPDGSCVKSVSNCGAPPTCPAERCSSGYCVEDLRNCPSGFSCPVATPILCQDGSCVTSVDSCSLQPACPPEKPVRCPDNACTTDILLCPTKTICEAAKPVKCPDGQCAVALEACGPAPACSANLPYKCPGGECALVRELCPTHITCPYDVAPVRCLDGTCRTSLDQCPNAAISTCDAGQISCPQAGVGIPVCASRLENCPTNLICPADKSVRCIDSSCAASVADCPAIPTYPDSDSYIPCADGSWVTPSVSCPRPITCATSTPIKCWDGSCRVALGDCPDPDPCAGGYLCPNGACGGVPWALECNPARPTCGDPEAVYCEDSTCVTDVSLCPNRYSDPSYTKPNCPSGHDVYCRDGTCRSREGDCVDATCEGELPYLCPDGACRQKESDCLADDGCPQGWTKCPSGGCAEKRETCDPAVCTGQATDFQCDDKLLFGVTDINGNPLTCEAITRFDMYPLVCDDGSCAAEATSCPDFKGCFDVTAPFRCADGTCVSNSLACISGASTANVCPSYAPYRCSDGFCAISSTYCLSPTYNAGCKDEAPVQCADGSCADLNGACPLVKPCRKGEMRCGDGSCRDVKATGTICPNYDSCPTGTKRCYNGLCAPDGFCDLTPQGCPVGQTKCESGLCVLDGTPCKVLDAPSGCAANQVKCSEDGSCQDSEDLCVLGNGCKPGEIKCGDGSCVNADAFVADESICPTGGCSGFLCQNGVCKSSIQECSSANNGCPLDKPYRCADGTCQKYAAGTPGVPKADTCSTRVVCNPGNVLCSDGSCAIDIQYCTATACPTGQELCAKNYKCMTTEECTAVVDNVCPPKNPIICPSGECRESIEQCTGGTFGGGKPLQGCDDIVCFDGGCYKTDKECLEQKANFDGTTLDANQPLEGQVCKDEFAKYVCRDGRCVTDLSLCGVIGPCPPNTMRCKDGTCGSEDACKAIEVAKCSKGFRCEDGFCREKCLPYDGCGINPIPGLEKLATPFHCANRECAQNSKGCQSAETSPSRRRSLARRHMAQLDTPKACESNCYAQIKASILDISLSDQIKDKSSFTIAKGRLGEAIMTLDIPSGAVQFTRDVQSTTLKIRAVGEDQMRPAINPIHVSRRGDDYFKYDDVLYFTQSVISPAFECYVSNDIRQPFATNFTVTSTVDSTRYVPKSTAFQPQDLDWIQDVCLASLIRVRGYAFWSCTFGQSEARRLWCQQGFQSCSVGLYTSGLVWDPQADDQGQPTARPPLGGQTWKASSSFNRCLQSAGVEAGDVASTGVVYAFITNPLKEYVAPDNTTTEPQKSYALQITMGILGLLLVIGVGLYFIFRLTRYRKKYKKERAEADRLHEEMDNMEQFGTEAAGLKTGDVVMSKNPLAQQISHLSAAVDENEMKIQKAEQQLKLDEAGVRQNHLDNMKSNRDKMLDDLNKLKAQLASVQDQARGGATVVDENTSTGYGNTGDQWSADGGYDDPYADSDPYGGSDFSAAAPKRGGY